MGPRATPGSGSCGATGCGRLGGLGASPPLFRSNSSFSEKTLTLACLLRAAMTTFWSGAEERQRPQAMGLSLRAPGAGCLPAGPQPTWQVQVESQKQVGAQIWQLLRGVQGKAVLDNAQEELHEGRAQVLWKGPHGACSPAPPATLPGRTQQVPGPRLPAGSRPAACLLTVVCVGHCLPHGEDHSQDEGGVTEFLVVWGEEVGRQSPAGGGNPQAANRPRLTLRVCLHVPRQLNRKHRRHKCGDDGGVQAAHGTKALEQQESQRCPVLLAGGPVCSVSAAPTSAQGPPPLPSVSHTIW